MNTETIKQWGGFLRRLRDFFESRGFLEVTTPVMVEAGAFESVIDTIKVEGGGELQSSPELAMKRFVSETLGPIYQICPSFRDDPISKIHRKEFTMLEFYQPSATYKHCINTMKELLQSLSSTPLQFREFSVRKLFLSQAGIELTEDREKFAVAARELGCSISDSDEWNDIFFKIMIDVIEPKLNPEFPTIVRNYPASLSALSRLSDDGQTADKFEIYWKGMEICNGCSELTDPEMLKERWKAENESRLRSGKSPHPEPRTFFASAEEGFIPSAGVAVGLNRLFACYYGEPFFL